MVLFPIFEMVMMRSDCDPTFPFRRLNFLYLDFMGKLKVLEPSLDWVFTLILSTKTNRTIMSYVSYPSRKCTSLFDLNFSGLWIYILVLSHLPIFIEKRKRKVGQHFSWSCPWWESFLQKGKPGDSYIKECRLLVRPCRLSFWGNSSERVSVRPP